VRLTGCPVGAISQIVVLGRKFFFFSGATIWAALLCQAQQPQAATLPPQVEIEHNLVNVGMIYPPPVQEIRYSTLCNFTGEVLYPFPAAFVHKDVAAALQKVQEELKAEGLCLKIFDGYRPLSVQKKMWARVPDERFVSEPGKSRGSTLEALQSMSPSLIAWETSSKCLRSTTTFPTRPTGIRRSGR
jgi:D-ala-D-ala dipeptidase